MKNLFIVILIVIVLVLVSCAPADLEPMRTYTIWFNDGTKTESCAANAIANVDEGLLILVGRKNVNIASFRDFDYFSSVEGCDEK